MGVSYEVLQQFSKQCPMLEQISWNNINRNYSRVDLDGGDMRHANNNLKEIT